MQALILAQAAVVVRKLAVVAKRSQVLTKASNLFGLGAFFLHTISCKLEALFVNRVFASRSFACPRFKRLKEKNMQKVIKFVFVVMLAVGAVGLTSTAGADPGYGGGAKSCSSC